MLPKWIILLVLPIFIVRANGLDKKIFKFQRSVENLVKDHGPYLDTNRRIVYASCDVTCSVTVEKQLLEDVYSKDTCTFALEHDERFRKGPMSTNEPGKYVLESRQKYRKYLYYNTGQSPIHYNHIIRFINMGDCSVNVIKKSLPRTHFVAVVKYFKDKLEVFILKQSRKGQGENNSSMVAYDFNGDSLYSYNLSSIYIPRSSVEIFPRSKTTSAEGFYMVLNLAENGLDYGKQFLVINFVLPSENSVKIILETEFKWEYTEIVEFDKTPTIEGSTDHDLFGLCMYFSYYQSEIICAQYDKNHNEVMNMTTLNFSNPVYLNKVFNLAEGGLLLVTTECDDKYVCTSVTIHVVMPSGRIRRSIQIASTRFEFEWHIDDHAAVDMQESTAHQQEVCFYFMHKSSKVTYFNVCIPKDELK